MTVIEGWRFRGGELDFEVEYAVESKRLDDLTPKFQLSYETFRSIQAISPPGIKQGGVSVRNVRVFSRWNSRNPRLSQVVSRAHLRRLCRKYQRCRPASWNHFILRLAAGL